jgi:glycosyltransferase involved in cell wall biosynthesis
MDDIGGGTGNHVLSLVSRMRDVEPVFATTGRHIRSRLATATKQEFYFVAPRRPYEIPVVHQARMLSDLYRFARGREIDIIHSYFFWSILFGRFLKRMLGVRLLVENREDLGFQWGAFEYALLRAGRRVPDRVICVAEAVREKALRSEKLRSERAIVIRNGFEPHGSDAAPGDLRGELGIPKGVPVIGAVANLCRVKRLDRLVRATKKLRERIPGIRVVLVGRGAEEEALRRLAAETCPGDALLFAGYHPKIEAVYRTLDLSVLTSSSEGCSITILESLDAGLPVVATDVGGNRELVTDGENGYLVPDWDEEVFVERVARLLADKELRARMGEKGRALVRSKHALDSVAQAYRAVYAAGE